MAENLVNFRHKLLNFERPRYPPHQAQTIPRFYASYYDWHNLYFPINTCPKQPHKYPVKLPVSQINIEKTFHFLPSPLKAPKAPKSHKKVGCSIKSKIICLLFLLYILLTKLTLEE